MPQREQLKISLPPDLVLWVDEARGDLSRSRFVENALKQYSGAPSLFARTEPLQITEDQGETKLTVQKKIDPDEVYCNAMTTPYIDPKTICSACGRPLGEHRMIGANP